MESHFGFSSKEFLKTDSQGLAAHDGERADDASDGDVDERVAGAVSRCQQENEHHHHEQHHQAIHDEACMVWCLEASSVCFSIKCSDKLLKS